MTRPNMPPLGLLVNNILKCYYLSTPLERDAGIDWYMRASNIAHTINNELHFNDFRSVCAIIAVLSPNNTWERNCEDAYNLIRDFLIHPDLAQNTSVGTYGANKKKAIDILHDDPHNCLSYVRGLKVNSFFECIYHGGFTDTLCIDTHAVSIALDTRITTEKMSSVWFRNPRYNLICNAYRLATEKIHPTLFPCQVQAITWLTWRRIHGIG